MEFKSTVTAFLALVMFSLPDATLAEERVDRLLRDLAQAEDENSAKRLENELVAEWSKSGSAAMDLLLRRGRDALEVQDVSAALQHFRALTDHAPEFAEGWHGLALAFFMNENYGPALDALEHVLSLNPQHFGALKGVGAIHEQVNRPALAYEAYSQVLDLRPHDSEIIEALKRLERVARGVAL